jgi:hypothetical protein
MWRGTNNELSIWRLDPNLVNPVSAVYGPYDGWEPIALTVLCNNHTYVLWRHTSGEIQVFNLDQNLNLGPTLSAGPYTGWIAESLSPDQNSPGNFLILWRETLGSIAIWHMNSSPAITFSSSYGPYFGFDPTSHANARSGGAGSTPSSDPGTEIMKRKGDAMPQSQ